MARVEPKQRSPSLLNSKLKQKARNLKRYEKHKIINYIKKEKEKEQSQQSVSLSNCVSKGKIFSNSVSQALRFVPSFIILLLNLNSLNFLNSNFGNLKALLDFYLFAVASSVLLFFL